MRAKELLQALDWMLRSTRTSEVECRTPSLSTDRSNNGRQCGKATLNEVEEYIYLPWKQAKGLNIPRCCEKEESRGEARYI